MEAKYKNINKYQSNQKHLNDTHTHTKQTKTTICKILSCMCQILPYSQQNTIPKFIKCTGSVVYVN